MLQWIDLLEAYLIEAKWFNKKYVPAFGEYLDNGVISSGSCLALVHATFLIGDNLSKETISMMSPYPRLFSCSGEILRLWDDLGTSKVSHSIFTCNYVKFLNFVFVIFEHETRERDEKLMVFHFQEEQKRGDNACSIQCLMKENDISDETFARKHIRQVIGNLWSELNSLVIATTTLPFTIRKASLNMARTSQFIYQHGDDQTMPTVNDLVKLLIFTPSKSGEESNTNCVV